eukprot:6846102-Lingulodinium_polyedra.AAC.1
MSGVWVGESYVDTRISPGILLCLRTRYGQKPEGTVGVSHPLARTQSMQAGVDVVPEEARDEERAP